jgi:hypothetical protein
MMNLTVVIQTANEEKITDRCETGIDEEGEQGAPTKEAEGMLNLTRSKADKEVRQIQCSSGEQWEMKRAYAGHLVLQLLLIH